MARINLRDVILNDGFPGPVNPNKSVPTDGWDNTVDNDVTVPTHPLGTKIMDYNDSSQNPGWYTCAYLRWSAVSGKNDISDISTGWGFCHRQDGTTSVDATASPWNVTGQQGITDSTRNTMFAVACGTMTSTDVTLGDTGKYGWFWIEGVKPRDTTLLDSLGSGLGVEVTTDGNVIAGGRLQLIADTSQLIFGLADASVLTVGTSLVIDA